MKSIVMMPKSIKWEICSKKGIILPEMKMTKKIENEIKELQQSQELLIPHSSFIHCVKNVVNEYSPKKELRIEKQVHHSLQQASESFLVSLFQEANMIAQHAKRQTIYDRDLLLALRLTSSFHSFSPKTQRINNKK